MSSMTLKQGDTAPKAAGDLNADITGATVFFRLKKLNGQFVMSRTATITDAPTGLVEYQWATADWTVMAPTPITNRISFLGEFFVTFTGGLIERFPQRWNLEIIVLPAAPAA